ncbi:hypothetical protein, partial [Gloeocapsopsis dulcis]|uniref:hypothetical protein n=1 Tax=Gloeocapsopsis dulcis TaxID=2859516 RepID=UPI001F39641F
HWRIILGLFGILCITTMHHYLFSTTQNTTTRSQVQQKSLKAAKIIFLSLHQNNRSQLGFGLLVIQDAVMISLHRYAMDISSLLARAILICG